MVVPLSFDESEPSSLPELSSEEPIPTVAKDPAAVVYTTATNKYNYSNNARLRKPQQELLSPSVSDTPLQDGLEGDFDKNKGTTMPRSHQGGAYELLETGSGPGSPRSKLFGFLRRGGSRGGNTRNNGGGNEKVRFTWKRLGVGAFVFIVFVWVVGPRIRSARYGTATGGAVSSESGNPYDSEMDMPGDMIPSVPTPPATATDHPPTVWYPDIDDDLSAHSPPTPSSSSSGDGDLHHHPTSYSTDPNPSSTTYCTAPHNSSLPLVQYALMIDAGSTGSRIHIYKFNNCGRSTPSFEYETFKMTQPGLSAYAGRPAADAARSLDVLMDEAVKVVPEELRSCTPVAVKATAGLRLLPGTQSAEILGAVEKRLRERYPFRLVDKDGVVVMDGKDEGVYAWITVNYLMGTIKDGKPAGGQTYAVLDLGGASTQIVFEPEYGRGEEYGEGGGGGGKMEEGEHKYDVKFAGVDHVLYQHSYLGYGLMRARMHVHRLVDFMDTIRANHGHGNVVGNPCLAKGTQRRVEITDEKTREKRNVTMGGEDVGSFEGCNRLMQLVLAKDAICELKPCSFDGVYQPTLLSSFPSGKVLLLSYFYDRLSPLLPSSLPSPITVSTVANISQSVCEGRSRWLEEWGAKSAVMKELEDRPEWCLDLTFMYTLLRLGYEFEDRREIKLGKKIKGTELGWCLGAAIAMVGGSEVSCRA